MRARFLKVYEWGDRVREEGTEGDMPAGWLVDVVQNNELKYYSLVKLYLFFFVSQAHS